MKVIGLVMLLAASFCFAQDPGDFKPATSNVLDAQYPKVDGNSRVQIRFKAPEATKVKLNFWSGPKVDMEKQADGFWTFTTPPMAPGLHYYTIDRGWRRGERSGQHGLLWWKQMGERG